MTLRKLLGLVALSALAVGCGEQRTVPAGAGSPDAAAPATHAKSTPSAARAAVARAMGIAARVPVLAARLAPAPSTWKLDGKRLASPGWRSPRMGVGAHLPATADGKLEVGPGASSPIVFEPEGARGAGVVDDQGRAVYADAYPSTDVVYVAARDRVEWFLTLKSAKAPHAFTWHATLPSDLVKLRREPSGALVVIDTRGTERLRMPVPYAVDAHGNRRDARLTWKDGELRVALDVAGLAYPVLLDPALVTAVWVQRFPTTSPSARAGGTMVYDSGLNRIVLIGGFGTGGGGGDVWQWDGTIWNQVAGAAPPLRTRAAAAYDTARNRIVLYGGADSSGAWLGDTWERSGTTWTEVATSGPPAGEGSMAYDSTRKRSVLFIAGSTWEWDGSTWTEVATTGPLATSGAVLAYDAAPARTVLFGGTPSGCPGCVTDLGNTWEWDGSSWTQVATTGPSARSASAMSYDSTRQRVVLFGGEYTTYGAGLPGYLGDTWQWDGTTWVQASTTGPSPRITQIAYDTQRKRVVLFGGADYQTQFDDTWEMHSHGGSCAADSECETGHCVDGVCCEQASCGTCEACNGSDPGNCTAVTNAQDPDTCTGAKSCGPTGLCDQFVNGQLCGPSTNCASGYCVDGVCCDQACTGACRVCSKAKGATADGTCTVLGAGSAGSPSCSPFVCNGGAACPTSCAADSDCITGDYCAADGTCKAQKAQGSVCNTAAGQDCKVAGCGACATGHCVDGVCCDSACSGTCQACTAAMTGGSDGTCAPVTKDTDPHDGCGDCALCDGAGACANVAAGTDPKDRCTADANYPGSCLADGQCDGQGNCRKYSPQGTACGTASCTNGTAQGQLCNGSGNCTTSSTSCGEFKCDPAGTACLTSCTTDADCASGAFCGNGTCTTKKVAGTKCGKGTECATGYCADGVCCDTACTGQCEACDVAPNAGTCVPVKGPPEHQPCTGTGTECDGSCDGVNRSACTYPGPDQACGNASCTGGNAQASACDGKGNCSPPTTVSCAPYKCNGTKCGDTCSADTDCASGYSCDTTQHACTPGGKCDGTKLLDANGKVLVDCSPNLCANGACVTPCTKSADCVAGYVCDSSDGQCKKSQSGSANNSGGCGCRTAGQRGESGGVPILLALGLLGFALERRRRA